ncbi:MAG: helix-hairpin-helix domain-containing protein [Bacteroidia bacterium]|jgi:competence protein ComEA
MKKFIKTNFDFTHTEVRGLTLLLILIVLVEFVRSNYPKWFPDAHYTNIRFTPFQKQWIDSLHQVDRLAFEKKRYKSAEEFERFEFNPNTLAEEGWVRLGFTSKQAASIVKLRNKGFRFKQKQDLKKIFCVSEKKYQDLEAFIRLDTKDENSVPKENKQHAAFAKLELNTSDSSGLLSIKGIGPFRASKIIRHRTRLGGFWSLNQLKEIKGFNDTLIADLSRYLTVDSMRINRIRINTIAPDELQKHPYCWYGVGKSIVNYRSKHGQFRSTDDLRKIYALKPEQIERLSHYLSFE